MALLARRLQHPQLLRLQLRTCLHDKTLRSKDLHKYQYRQFQTFSPCYHPRIWQISLRRPSKHQRLLLSPKHHSLKRSQLPRIHPHRLCRPIWGICWHLSRLKVSCLVRQAHQSMAPMCMHPRHLPHKLHHLYLEASNIRL